MCFIILTIPQLSLFSKRKYKERYHLSENVHKGHRQRLKNEILSYDDAAKIPPEKLLEMLLFYGIPQKDTAYIARDMLKRFGGLAGVFEADIDSLTEVKGMTRNAASLIKLMRPIGRAYLLAKYDENVTLKTFEEIGRYIQVKFFNLQAEAFCILCLNRLGEVIYFELISDGGIDSVGVSTRLIVEKVLKTKATAVVIAHNHPGAIALPSAQDIVITEQIALALASVDVNLVDHIILSDDDYVSMAQSERFSQIFNK